MNKAQNAVNQLISGIIKYVENKISNLDYDKTVSGIIINTSENNTYTIKIKNIEYNNIPTIGGSCAVNEVVRVLIPMSNYNNMIILKA